MFFPFPHFPHHILFQDSKSSKQLLYTFYICEITCYNCYSSLLSSSSSTSFLSHIFQTNTFSTTLKHVPIERQHLRHRLRRIIILRRRRQDLQSTLRYQQRMLELCRSLSIGGDDGPVVRPALIVAISLINHRLDGEDHSWPHRSLRVVVYNRPFRASIRR